MSVYRKLWCARIREISTPGAPHIYQLETMRTPQQQGWGLAGVFTTRSEADEMMDALIADHHAAANETIVRDWHA